MEFFAWYNLPFFAWYNLPFFAPILLGLIYSLVQVFAEVFGGYGGEGSEVHAEVGDADLHIPDGIHQEVTLHGGGEHSGPSEDGVSVSRLLDSLGVGRIPLTVVIQAFLYSFGFLGIASNMVLGSFLRFPALYFWLSLVIAFIGAVAGTALLSKPLAKLIPRNETFADGPEAFLGQGADAFYRITADSGAVRLTDSFGFSRELKVRLLPGETEELEKGEHVLLTKYDPDSDVYFARRHPNATRQLGN